MIKPLLLIALVGLLPVSAYADQTGGAGCPPIDGKNHRLMTGQTATLYLGDPARKGTQAPDSDDGRVSIFRLPQGGAGYFFECHYRGVTGTTPVPVPDGAKQCRQDATSFVCR